MANSKSPTKILLIRKRPHEHELNWGINKTQKDGGWSGPVGPKTNSVKKDEQHKVSLKGSVSGTAEERRGIQKKLRCTATGE